MKRRGRASAFCCSPWRGSLFLPDGAAVYKIIFSCIFIFNSLFRFNSIFIAISASCVVPSVVDKPSRCGRVSAIGSLWRLDETWGGEVQFHLISILVANYHPSSISTSTGREIVSCCVTMGGAISNVTLDPRDNEQSESPVTARLFTNPPRSRTPHTRRPLLTIPLRSRSPFIT